MSGSNTRTLRLVVAFIAGIVVGAWAFRPSTTGSGGIGSVSAGISEAIVELLLILILIGVVWFALRVVRRTFRSRRAPGPPSGSSPA